MIDLEHDLTLGLEFQSNQTTISLPLLVGRIQQSLPTPRWHRRVNGNDRFREAKGEEYFILAGAPLHKERLFVFQGDDINVLFAEMRERRIDPPETDQFPIKVAQNAVAGRVSQLVIDFGAKEGRLILRVGRVSLPGEPRGILLAGRAVQPRPARRPSGW